MKNLKLSTLLISLFYLSSCKENSFTANHLGLKLANTSLSLQYQQQTSDTCIDQTRHTLGNYPSSFLNKLRMTLMILENKNPSNLGDLICIEEKICSMLASIKDTTYIDVLFQIFDPLFYGILSNHSAEPISLLIGSIQSDNVYTFVCANSENLVELGKKVSQTKLKKAFDNLKKLASIENLLRKLINQLNFSSDRQPNPPASREDLLASEELPSDLEKEAADFIDKIPDTDKAFFADFKEDFKLLRDFFETYQINKKIFGANESSDDSQKAISSATSSSLIWP